MVARRVAGEPLQYVIGWAPFGRLRLRVGPGVFVPGPRPRAWPTGPPRSSRPRALGGRRRPVRRVGGDRLLPGRRGPRGQGPGHRARPGALAWARGNAERFELLAGDLDAPLPARAGRPGRRALRQRAVRAQRGHRHPAQRRPRPRAPAGPRRRPRRPGRAPAPGPGPGTAGPGGGCGEIGEDQAEAAAALLTAAGLARWPSTPTWSAATGSWKDPPVTVPDQLPEDPRIIPSPTTRSSGRACSRSAARSSPGAGWSCPTDTLYGVGCDPFNASAVDALFQAKQRGRDLPLPVLVHTWRQAIGLVDEVTDQAQALIAAWWPGPLTLVLREAPASAGTSATRGARWRCACPSRPSHSPSSSAPAGRLQRQPLRRADPERDPGRGLPHWRPRRGVLRRRTGPRRAGLQHRRPHRPSGRGCCAKAIPADELERVLEEPFDDAT